MVQDIWYSSAQMKTRLTVLLALLPLAFARPADAPDSSLYTVIRGAFVIEGYEPDGDSLRFIADDVKDWDKLENAKYLRQVFLETDSNQRQDNPNKKNSVQLRFEGIDTPEFDDGGKRQPLGKQARDFTLAYLGFKQIEYTPAGKQVRSASPKRIRGVLLGKSAIGGTNGRPIVYVFKDDDWTQKTSLQTVVQAKWLESSLNVALLKNGLAFNEFYNSMPPSHRELFGRTAHEAQSTGVWKQNQSQNFDISSRENIRENGVLVLPKLFRRLENYFEAQKKGETKFGFWHHLKAEKGIENDEIRVGTKELKFSDVLVQEGNRLRLTVSPLELLFY
jgi:endonuclease YncB( thermonuclease family)